MKPAGGRIVLMGVAMALATHRDLSLGCAAPGEWPAAIAAAGLTAGLCGSVPRWRGLTWERESRGLSSVISSFRPPDAACWPVSCLRRSVAREDRDVSGVPPTALAIPPNTIVRETDAIERRQM